ncbi:tyrosine-type recombinase/integrase [Nocardiopsis nanhaiensis]
MGYAESRGTYFRGRYKRPDGSYGTVADSRGKTIKFPTKTAAKQAATAAETDVRRGEWTDPRSGRITFGEYAGRWYAAQDLAPSTMQNLKRHIEEHLLPEFESWSLADITSFDVDAWERREKEAGYAVSSVKTWRGTLHTMLGDAVDEGAIAANPATKRRGRGKRAGRSRARGPEKVITNTLGALRIAERAALLSGRDDEFVAVLLKFFTGVRWAELVGLETKYVRAGAVRVEAQLWEDDDGVFHLLPPKEDSYRTVDIPDFLGRLVADHIEASAPTPCECHGRTFVFKGAAKIRTGGAGAKLVDVARLAGVSSGTVSNVLNKPETVSETTRRRVTNAVSELGFVHGGSATTAPHWRRNGFATWVFSPSASGRYPKKAPQPERPVPVTGEPWPGVPVRGRNAAARASGEWEPVAAGLTPHGLRHSNKTAMVELGMSAPLMDERLGHEDGSVQSRYSHVTPEMRRRLMDALTREWERALDARLELASGSPVAVLESLLREREAVRAGNVVPLRGAQSR